ncbi:MAG TPA: sulfite exporter TauE/SafE family protein [Steroidobacteraceae bacterium]|nr:sulfite exporter TauE/SafE family protein [Steroidobacteraceae bacterium]
MTITVLLAALAALGLAFSFALLRTAAERGELRPRAEAIGLGAIANFFDTLGIGSFATTTAWIKFRRLVPDSFIPATLNVGHALPTVAQSAIFLVILGVHVDPALLASCIVAAVLGSLVGARLVVRAPVRLVQAVVGFALIVAALLYAMSNLDLMPIGGQATALPAGAMAVAVSVHFVLGALMAFGIGLYAPSLILLSLLGLDPRLAFPIMASACAFLMPVTGFSFMKSKRIDLRVILGIALGGIPAVLVAAFVVKEMPIVWLRWGVVVVVLYAAFLLLRAAFGPRSVAQGEPA